MCLVGYNESNRRESGLNRADHRILELSCGRMLYFIVLSEGCFVPGFKFGLTEAALKYRAPSCATFGEGGKSARLSPMVIIYF